MNGAALVLNLFVFGWLVLSLAMGWLWLRRAPEVGELVGYYLAVTGGLVVLMSLVRYLRMEG